MTDYWLEVSVVTDGEAAEAVAEALRPLAPADGVVLEQRGDPHNLDPAALEPEVIVKIYLPAEEDTPALRRRIQEIIYHLGRLYPIPEPIFRKLEEKDWANAWKDHYKPFRVGQRLWIQPSWLEVGEEVAAEDIVLTLDPGMAFGTGLHPTTQMCLQALERLVEPGMVMLDVGTGSGILAVAAIRLGAAAVHAVDTDKLAVEATRLNARQNSVLDRISVDRGSLADVPSAQWDLVVVNILAPVIISMLRDGKLLERLAPQGRLVLSGIIDRQLPDVQSALTDAGATIKEQLEVRDWVALIVQRQP